LKILNKALLLLLFTAAFAFIVSCQNSGDMPNNTDTSGFGTEPQPETDDIIAPVTEPESGSVTEETQLPAPDTEPPKEPDKLEQLLAGMTLEEKVGQMFLVGCDTKTAESDVRDFYLGGLVLFAADSEGRKKQQAAETIASYQAAAKVPLIIAVDEEGGTVVRVSKFPQYRGEPFEAPQAIYGRGGLNALLSDVDEKTSLLRSLGINCNLAPVCDVSLDPKSYIYPRTLGLDGKKTAEVIAAVTLRYVELGMGCVLKHFPGYGDNLDTHEGISVDRRDFSELERSDLLPFAAGIQAGAGAVMVSHNIVTSIDPDYPSSLSPKAYALLRGQLGFEGVIMTDALDMGAIVEFAKGRDESPAVLAVLAGCDMVCISDFKEAYSEVLAAVKAGKIPVSRVDESVMRILRWKESLGILG